MIRTLLAAPILAIILAIAGAPAPAAAQPPVLVVFFPLWSGALDDAGRAVIQRAATIAKQRPDAQITVTGYADSIGSAAADVDLTQLRAQRVIDVMVRDGVPAERMQLVAKGAQPEPGIASRRVEILISAP